MTFDQRERSNYDGIPATLYEFVMGDTTWAYTDAQNDITVGDITYTAIAISHDEYSRSGDPSDDDLTINLSHEAQVVRLFIGTPPSETLALRIRSIHRGDTEAPVVWSGSVKSHKQVSQAQHSFVCNSLLATLGRNGLRLSWGRGCPHALYDRLCRVNPDDHGIAVQIVSLTGNAISAPALATLPSGHLSGGFLSFPTEHGTTDRRAIETHEGETAFLLGTTDGMVVDDWIMVYPGCDRTTSDCELRFQNLSNYGGFPHLPTKSPFDGDPVF